MWMHMISMACCNVWVVIGRKAPINSAIIITIKTAGLLLRWHGRCYAVSLPRNAAVFIVNAWKMRRADRRLLHIRNCSNGGTSPSNDHNMSVERIDHAAFGGGGLLLAALEAEVSAIELCSWFVHGSFMYVVHLLPPGPCFFVVAA